MNTETNEAAGRDCERCGGSLRGFGADLVRRLCLSCRERETEAAFTRELPFSQSSPSPGFLVKTDSHQGTRARVLVKTEDVSPGSSCTPGEDLGMRALLDAYFAHEIEPVNVELPELPKLPFNKTTK